MSGEKTIRIQDNLGRGNYYGFALSDVRAAIEAEGLHIVTAKDKAVLDAMAAGNFVWIRSMARSTEGPVDWADWMRSVLRAEIERREGET